ncbi:FtsK/SpoIIIE domain-containing protein [Polyangium mundeleinium]|uniref:FtsK/SpoIIIE domain-containing protein n=1 Tax=Polyangium mundeleinium TaxID=2995306 RepID=A0ABT5ETU9_9BACT|nr:FtsK/SpoIIIE domain-containing protein [Polyangium mundeleinium]MDC0744779.1 FtsK/SpoIIIE domain-containing protein [Polyangium mundeleinium]
MPVELSVKEVREELSRAAGAAEVGGGERATLLLGRLFHEVFAEAIGRDPGRSGVRVLMEAGPDREIASERLIAHLYRVLVGPRLARHHAHLRETTPQVLVFWQATQNLARWLAGITWALVDADRPMSWEEVTQALHAEVSLACELREPGWTDTVRLVGIADALLHVPGKPHFCALELKLGRANPAVDLGQAALYRLIAARMSRGAGASALALVRFSPEIEETLISAAQVVEAEARLLALIGTLTGVALRSPAPVRAPKRPSMTPTDAPKQKPQTSYAELGLKLARAFREYGRSIEITGEPAVGPRFLRFEARLGRGVTFDQIARLTTEVGLKVGVGKEPIVSRDGGRLCMDLQRPDPQTVPFSVVVAALGPRDTRHGSSRLPLGVDLDGKLRFADLASPINAHVLVAGTTGSGKTEWLRMAIAGLMHANTPETLRLVLVDPKLSAFLELRRSRYLWPKHGLWVPGDKDVVEVLEDLVDEMDRRYKAFGALGVDDLTRFVEKKGRPLPRIVLFCDEYFALISQDRQQRKQIEGAISLLGAKARAAGIHLVIATQQPSRQVIQGALDSNMPCRVGLMTQSAIESRMILQAPGAERLTGYGDLLYKDVGDPIRLQAPYLSAEERARMFGGG